MKKSSSAYIIEQKTMVRTKNPRNIEIKNQDTKCKN